MIGTPAVIRPKGGPTVGTTPSFKGPTITILIIVQWLEEAFNRFPNDFVVVHFLPVIHFTPPTSSARKNILLHFRIEAPWEGDSDRDMSEQPQK